MADFDDDYVAVAQPFVGRVTRKGIPVVHPRSSMVATQWYVIMSVPSVVRP